jgi:TRAP-type transport system small permease protein
MRKFMDGLFRTIEVLIAIFLAAMIFLVFVNVVLRYIFNKGFAWSEEIARLCFIYLVYLGSIEAARDNRHLLIDSLLLKFPEHIQKIVYVLIQICIIWLMWKLTLGSWGLVVQNLYDRWVATGFPTYLVYTSGLITGIAIIIISIGNIFRLIFLKESVSILVKSSGENQEEEITSSAQ